MRKILCGAAVAFIIGGVTMIASLWGRLWGGIALIAVGLGLALIAWKHKGDEQMQKEGKQNIIKDTELKAKVKHAKEALGADFEGNYELDNVRVELEAENVEQATGAKFRSSNGTTPITGMIMSCSNCGKTFPRAFTGCLPEETACPHCGHMNKVS